MRIENGKVYASPKVARFWRPILQPPVDFLGEFLRYRGATAAILTACLLLHAVGL